MLSNTTTATATFIAAYNRNGSSSLRFRADSAQQIAPTSEQGSTTQENYKDQVTLSESGVEKSHQDKESDSQVIATHAPEDADQQKNTAEQAKTDGQPLTPEEQKMVAELQQRDREVKIHEQAHMANAGQYARGGATYSYQQGPDGRRYAIGGEVPIDISPEKNPEQTIQKMQTVKRAAMAPAEPSSADRSIAAAAAALEAQARQEIQTKQRSAAAEPSGAGTQPPNDSASSRQSQTTPSNAARRAQPLDTVA